MQIVLLHPLTLNRFGRSFDERPHDVREGALLRPTLCPVFQETTFGRVLWVKLAYTKLHTVPSADLSRALLTTKPFGTGPENQHTVRGKYTP